MRCRDTRSPRSRCLAFCRAGVLPPPRWAAVHDALLVEARRAQEPDSDTDVELAEAPRGASAGGSGSREAEAAGPLAEKGLALL